MTKEQLTEKIQNDCHKLTDAMIKRSKKVKVQDATNVFLFHKLAEIELRLRQLEARGCYDPLSVQ